MSQIALQSLSLPRQSEADLAGLLSAQLQEKDLVVLSTSSILVLAHVAVLLEMVEEESRLRLRYGTVQNDRHVKEGKRSLSFGRMFRTWTINNRAEVLGCTSRIEAEGTRAVKDEFG
jgi:hypothetical protein